MSAQLWRTSTNNAFATTLDGGITDLDNTLTLTVVTGLQAPGVVVVDRVDSSDNATPAAREYISFTGISDKTLTGLSRGLGGSTAQEHSSGAVVEEVFSVSHWNDLLDFLEVAHDSSGNIVLSGNVTLTTGQFENIIASNSLNVSGASLIGFPLRPSWAVTVGASGASVNTGAAIPMPQSGTWEFFAATLTGPASGTTMVIDINKNYESIFEATTRLMIPAGGTFISTASINNKTFARGDIFSWDIDQAGDIVNRQSLSVIGKG